MENMGLTPSDVMLITKQHCSHGQSATAIGLAAGLSGGALLLAIAAAWGSLAEPQKYKTMAKTKSKERDVILPKQELIFTGIGNYQPLPRFQSGCKNCE